MRRTRGVPVLMCAAEALFLEVLASQARHQRVSKVGRASRPSRSLTPASTRQCAGLYVPGHHKKSKRWLAARYSPPSLHAIADVELCALLSAATRGMVHVLLPEGRGCVDIDGADAACGAGRSVDSADAAGVVLGRAEVDDVFVSRRQWRLALIPDGAAEALLWLEVRGG